MARRPSRSYSPAFKAKVAVAAINGEKIMIELAQEFDVHPAVTSGARVSMARFRLRRWLTDRPS